MKKEEILSVIKCEEYNGNNGHIDHMCLLAIDNKIIPVMMGHCVVGKEECLKARINVAKVRHDLPQNLEYSIINYTPTPEEKYIYMMLSRLQSDCEYYLGWGNRDAKRLWATDEREQIDEMKALWNKLDDDKKPMWLTWENILNYEKLMIV